MDFLALAARRQSTRAFTDTAVPDDCIRRCIEAARLAPSACNSQPWEFVVITDPSLRDQTARATCSGGALFNTFALQAPVLVLILSRPATIPAQIGGFLRGVPYYLLDIGMAAEHFCLQAASEGVGTCILGWIDERRIRKPLGIARSRKVVLALAVGYPRTPQIRPKNRRPLEEIMSWNSYRAAAPTPEQNPSPRKPQ